jgi:hypothetical protein
MIELRNQPHDLPVVHNRIGVEVLALKQFAEFPERQAACDRRDVARHVVGNNLVDEAIQDAILDRDTVLFNQVVSRLC